MSAMNARMRLRTAAWRSWPPCRAKSAASARLLATTSAATRSTRQARDTWCGRVGWPNDRASMGRMLEERRVRTSTPEWHELTERIHNAMGLTAQLNALPFADLDSRRALLTQLVGRPLPDTVNVMPPFYCTYGLGLDIGERTSVGQDCSFLDLGGITIGPRTMISPKVTLITEGHPIDPGERREFITLSPIIIEADVWIGAAATILPGVTIGHDSVVGAGAVVAKDVPPLSVVTGTSHVERRRLEPARGQRC